jgi:adenylate cyclase
VIRRRSAAAALTVIFVLLGGAWGGFLALRPGAGIGSALDRVESLSLGWRYEFIGARASPRGVVIAAIDDATIARAGSFPLPRDMLARIVRNLAAAGPQAIAIDLLLLDPGPPDADRELTAALRSARTVIGAAGLFDAGQAPLEAHLDAHLEAHLDAQGGVGGSGKEIGSVDLTRGGEALVPRPTRIQWPLPEFLAAAHPGLTNVTTDWLGMPRYVPLVFETGGTIVPSFALATAAAALNTDPVLGTDGIKLGARQVSTDLGYHLPLRFYGPRGAVRTFSASQAMDGGLDPADVRGLVVVLGSTYIGAGDRFATPFDRATPGVEILATAISNLLAGDALVRDPLTRGIDTVAAVVLPIAVVLLLAIRRLSVALPLALFAYGCWIFVGFVAFSRGYWLSLALPAAAVLPPAIGYGMARLAFTQRTARGFAAENDALRRFQPPLLLEPLVRNAGFLAEPVQQLAAVLFVDLSGFTGMAEVLGPAWTRDLLVRLHQIIADAAADLQGYVVSYMGDGAMIVFGLPAVRPDDASRALRAAATLHGGLSEWIAELPPVARERLRPRVGGHFGPVILSRLGAVDHQHITATGDTVNVASRLLEVSKERQAAMAVSEDLYRAATAEDDTEDGGYGPAIEVKIRGRVAPMSVRLWNGESA